MSITCNLNKLSVLWAFQFDAPPLRSSHSFSFFLILSLFPSLPFSATAHINHHHQHHRCLQNAFTCPDKFAFSLPLPLSHSPLAYASAQIAMDSDEPHENNQPSFCILHGCLCQSCLLAREREREMSRGRQAEREREVQAGRGVGQRLGSIRRDYAINARTLNSILVHVARLCTAKAGTDTHTHAHLHTRND